MTKLVFRLWMVIVALSILLTVLSIVHLTRPAHSGQSETCLTYRQARQLWPNRHLYWYSKSRCWSNRHGPPRGLKFDPVDDPVFPKVRKSMAQEPPDEDHCCWPPLDYDASGNLIEPPRTFTDKWNDQPWMR